MRGAGVAAAAVILLASTACSGSSDAGAQAAATPSAEASAAPSPSVDPIDPDVALTQAYSTTVFQPPLTVKLPADWYPTERDASAFQMYVGDENYEITFDTTSKRKETVAGAIARLKATEGIQAGPESPVTIGGRQGRAFVASRPGALRLTFSDSGFHVPGGNDIEVMAVPLADGTTLTAFITRRAEDGVTRPLEPTRRLARRIFATVTWR
jgi:hypothetical protein